MPVPGGDRRGGGAASRAPSVPRCGVSSPFRGHLSTKSNAFSIGHGSRLSDQYRIRDHMLVHYNKILTAKAAVDCSAPKSMTKSIKYNDQQRRERLKSVVTRIERHSVPSRASSSRPESRESLNSALQQKDLYNGYRYTLRQSPYSDPGASPTSFISLPKHFHSSEHAVDYRRRPQNLSETPSRMGCGLSGSSSWATTTRKFQDNREKTYSGDLIEKHANHFTSKQQPFTPRTLKTPAKSALAQSRFYTPPRRKRREGLSEAEVQTDISSFRDRHEAARNLSPDGNQAEENYLFSDEEEDIDGRRLSTSRMSYDESPSPTMHRIQSEEEELAYLEFVADVTNEILSLGLFSDRVLDRVFRRHLEENRHRLDEGKMLHLLNILRADLDTKEEKKPELFVDHSFTSSRQYNDPFPLSDTLKNKGFLSQEEDYTASLRYLNDNDDKPRLKDNLQTGLDREDSPEPSISLTCPDEGVLDHSYVISGQEDFEDTQKSPNATPSFLEDTLDSYRQKDDLLSLQDDHEETYSESHNKIQLSDRLSPVDNNFLEHNENQRSCSQMSLNDQLELDHKPRDLEELVQSFSDVIQVSKADDVSVHEEETENVPSTHEDNSDQDDF